jgi:hypothetical protein
MREHLERLLQHTRLKAVQRINLNRHIVEFTTLSKRRTKESSRDRIINQNATEAQALDRTAYRAFSIARIHYSVPT